MFRRATAAATALVLGVGALVAVPSAAAAPISMSAAADLGRTQTESTGDVVLAWDAVPGATGYTVQIADHASFGSANIVDKMDTTALAWAPTTGLWGANGPQALFWRVIANGVAADGTPQVHEFVRAQAPRPLLAQPAHGATVAYPTPAALSWEPVPGAVSYTLTYAKKGSTITSEVPGITTTQHTFTEPLTSGEWEWSVQAVFVRSGLSTATITGPSSDVRSFRVSWSIDDATPDLLFPAHAAHLNDLSFRWSSIDGASKYLVQLSQDEEFTAIELESEVTGTSFVLTRPLPSKTYYWRVRAYDTLGSEGPFSEVRQVRKIMGEDEASVPVAPLADTMVPEILTGSADSLAPTDLEYESFELRWTPVPRATFYEVTVTLVNGGTPVTCKTASTSATIIAQYEAVGNQTTLHESWGPCLWSTDSTRALRPGGGTYRVTVQAVNISADSSKQYQGSSSGDGDIVPSSKSEPRYFTLSQGAVATTTDVEPHGPELLQTTDVSPTLSWAPVEGANGYVVDLFSDTGDSSMIGQVWTPTPILRSNGVFARNTTDASYDAYRARVRPMVDATSNPSSWKELVGPQSATLSWKRRGEAPPAGSIETQGATKLLHMTPTAKTALGGSNRGYRVQIFEAGKPDAYTTLNVDQPMTAAVRTIGTGTKVVLTSLPQGLYEFRYSVLDAAGKPGPYSAKTPFDIGQRTATPLPVTAHPNSSSATLSWLPAVSAESYKVYLRAEGETTWRLVTGAAVKQPAVTLTDLIPGKSYSWFIVTVDKDKNESAPSTESGFTLPVAPVTLTSSTSELTPEDLKLSWLPVPGASRYLVRVAEAGRLATAPPVETSAASYVPTTALAFGKEYVWDVRAVPEKAYSASSTSRPVTGQSPEQPLAVTTLPAQVRNVRATVTNRSAVLTWEQLSGAAVGAPGTASYVVAFRPQGAGWTEMEPVRNSASSTIEGLAVDTTYDFRVAALTSIGQGPWSTSVSGKTATSPSAVQSLATTPKPGGATVSWRAPASNGGSTITSYEISYRVDGGAWTTVSTTSTSATLSSLAGERQYEVHVVAVNAIGAGQVATATVTPALLLPAQVRSLRVSVSGRTAALTWAELTAAEVAVPEPASYVVSYRPQGADWMQLAPVTGGGTSISNLALDASYEFRVAARTSIGQGPWSASATGRTATTPGVVQSLTTTPKLGGATVSWRAPASNGGSSITSYTLSFRLDGGGWTTVSTTSTSATLSSLAGERRYEVHVTAHNALGAGPVATATVTPLALPGVAGGVGAKRGDTVATVVWGAPATSGGSPVTAYVVELRSYASGRWSSWVTKGTVGAEARSYRATGLANGTRYEFRVVARTSLGSSSPSAAATVVPAGKPLAPTGVKAKALKKKKNVKVSWKTAASNGSKITKYVVQYSTTGKKWKTLTTVSAKSKSYTWTKAKSKKTMYYRVIAKNALGSSPASENASVKAR